MGKTATLANIGSVADGSLGFRNRIINGAMVIDQRNAGASYSPANATVVYGVDRWLTYSVGAGITAQRISNSGLTEFPYAFRQTGASGNTYASFVQRIESFNCLDLVGQQVTVSFFAATSNSSNVRVTIESAGTTDNFSAPTILQQQTVATTSTLTRYSVTFTALPSSVANGIQLDIEAASGIGAGVTLTITGVQLEKGSTATSFDYRPYGTELALCQRYFCVSAGGTQVAQGSSYTETMFQSGCGAVFGDSEGRCNLYTLPVIMRTSPTVTIIGNTLGASSQYSLYSRNGGWVAASSTTASGRPQCIEVNVIKTSGFVGIDSFIYIGGFIASAEL